MFDPSNENWFRLPAVCIFVERVLHILVLTNTKTTKSRNKQQRYKCKRSEIAVYRHFKQKENPEHNWSCIAHLSAEDMLIKNNHGDALGPNI